MDRKNRIAVVCSNAIDHQLLYILALVHSSSCHDVLLSLSVLEMIPHLVLLVGVEILVAVKVKGWDTTKVDEAHITSSHNDSFVATTEFGPSFFNEAYPKYWHIKGHRIRIISIL